MITQSLLVLFLVLLSTTKSMVVKQLGSRKDYVAEITDISLESLSEDQLDLIHSALLRYKVLVVRNQADFTVEGQRSFSKRFGRLHVHLESSSHMPGYDDVNVVSNMKVNGSHIGLFGKHVENFHADLSWNPLPAKITVLRSVIRPDQCGDTEFANTVDAYENLPAQLKQALTGKTAKYCYLKLREMDENGNVENLNADELEGANRCAIHPIFSTHPITGKKNILANPSDTTVVNNMTISRSEELLQQLFRYSANPEFIYRHHYEDNDVVLWDNRAVHHRATGCPEMYPRMLIRTTVSDDDYPKENILVKQPYNLEKDRLHADRMDPVFTMLPELIIASLN